MKVLVTGSSGRVGSAAAARLLAGGHAVRGLDLRASGREGAINEEYEDYEEVAGSLDDEDAVAAACSGVDAVLHLGALMSWDAADRAAMFRTNVEGTRVLLEAAAKAGVARVAFASSGEVYPETAPAFQPLTEDHPLRPNSHYGLTKLLGEEIAQFHGRVGSFETVVLRLSHTQDAAELLDEDSFFSGPRFFLRPRLRQQLALGNVKNAELLRAADPGRPAHVLARDGAGRPYSMHVTDTRDIVAGAILALTHPAAAGETFNLGATDPVDFAALLSAMSEITGYPVVPVDFPGAGVDYRTSNERIRRTLGFEPAWSIEAMLAEASEARARRERA